MDKDTLEEFIANYNEEISELAYEIVRISLGGNTVQLNRYTDILIEKGLSIKEIALIRTAMFAVLNVDQNEVIKEMSRNNI